MMNDMELLGETQRLLDRINVLLKQALPKIKGPGVKDIVLAENLSRFKRMRISAEVDALTFAKKRCDLKAKENGEVRVLVQHGIDLLTIEKGRFLKEKPFGLSKKDILYTSVGK